MATRTLRYTVYQTPKTTQKGLRSACAVAGRAALSVIKFTADSSPNTTSPFRSAIVARLAPYIRIESGYCDAMCAANCSLTTAGMGADLRVLGSKNTSTIS